MKKVINHIKADAYAGKDWTTAGCDCKACAGERGYIERLVRVRNQGARYGNVPLVQQANHQLAERAETLGLDYYAIG